MSVCSLKNLVEMGYIHRQRCKIDRRSIRVRLVPREREIRDFVTELFWRHVKGLQSRNLLGQNRPKVYFKTHVGYLERKK